MKIKSQVFVKMLQKKKKKKETFESIRDPVTKKKKKSVPILLSKEYLKIKTNDALRR